MSNLGKIIFIIPWILFSIHGQSSLDTTDLPSFQEDESIPQTTAHPIPTEAIQSRTLRISVNGAPGTFTIDQLRNSMAHLLPGTNIEFGPGVYSVSEPLELRNLRNITITGSANTEFVGAQGPPAPDLQRDPCSGSRAQCRWPGRGRWQPEYIDFNGFAIFKVESSQNISFSNFQIRNSWPNGISLSDSNTVNVDQVRIRGGTNGIYARGEQTHHINIRNSQWSQDTNMWNQRSWQHVHHGTENYLNGAFFQARDIRGDVRIENNRVADAFNGIRIKASRGRCPSPNPCNLNRNVVIDNNEFTRIADNVVEPETYAANWNVTNNRITDAHGAFSFDGVHGENFRMSGNTVNIESKPRTHIPEQVYASLVPEERDPHNGGCIFKLKGVGQIQNFLVENNSFAENFTPPGQRGKKFNKGSFPEGTVLRQNRITGNFRNIPEQQL